MIHKQAKINMLNHVENFLLEEKNNLGDIHTIISMRSPRIWNISTTPRDISNLFPELDAEIEKLRTKKHSITAFTSDDLHLKLIAIQKTRNSLQNNKL